MDPELSFLLEQLFFGRTLEITQPLQVTVLGTDFGSSITSTQGSQTSNLAASALDLAVQTSARNSSFTRNVTTNTPNTTSNFTNGLGNTMFGNRSGGGY